MNHRGDDDVNIEGKLVILDKKEDILKTIIDFLDINYNKL